MADMPPAQKITNEDIANAIRNPEDKPVSTPDEIGDQLGVVGQTIRNRMNTVLEEYEEIKKGEIDRATVYWTE